MKMRKEFTMTAEQHERLLDACKPVPYMVIGGMQPRSPQQNANAAWAALGAEMGFDPMSVQPVQGKGSEVFTAEATHVEKQESDASKPEERMLKWFEWSHLPPHLQEVSKPFSGLAKIIASDIEPGPERTAALRKLLEAKDAAVRAKVNPGG
jgi:hypothetical protein